MVQRLVGVAYDHRVTVVQQELAAATRFQDAKDLRERAVPLRVLERVLPADGIEPVRLEGQLLGGHTRMELDAGEQRRPIGHVPYWIDLCEVHAVDLEAAAQRRRRLLRDQRDRTVAGADVQHAGPVGQRREKGHPRIADFARVARLEAHRATDERATAVIGLPVFEVHSISILSARPLRLERRAGPRVYTGGRARYWWRRRRVPHSLLLQLRTTARRGA